MPMAPTRLDQSATISVDIGKAVDYLTRKKSTELGWMTGPSLQGQNKALKAFEARVHLDRTLTPKEKRKHFHDLFMSLHAASQAGEGIKTNFNFAKQAKIYPPTQQALDYIAQVKNIPVNRNQPTMVVAAVLETLANEELDYPTIQSQVNDLCNELPKNYNEKRFEEIQRDVKRNGITVSKGDTVRTFYDINEFTTLAKDNVLSGEQTGVIIAHSHQGICGVENQYILQQVSDQRMDVQRHAITTEGNHPAMLVQIENGRVIMTQQMSSKNVGTHPASIISTLSADISALQATEYRPSLTTTPIQYDYQLTLADTKRHPTKFLNPLKKMGGRKTSSAKHAEKYLDTLVLALPAIRKGAFFPKDASGVTTPQYNEINQYLEDSIPPALHDMAYSKVMRKLLSTDEQLKALNDRSEKIAYITANIPHQMHNALIQHMESNPVERQALQLGIASSLLNKALEGQTPEKIPELHRSLATTLPRTMHADAIIHFNARHQLTEEQKIELVTKSHLPDAQIYDVVVAIANNGAQREKIYKQILIERALEYNPQQRAALWKAAKGKLSATELQSVQNSWRKAVKISFIHKALEGQTPEKIPELHRSLATTLPRTMHADAIIHFNARHQLTEEQKIELVTKSRIPDAQIHRVVTEIADSSKQRDQMYKQTLVERALEYNPQQRAVLWKTTKGKLSIAERHALQQEVKLPLLNKALEGQTPDNILQFNKRLDKVLEKSAHSDAIIHFNAKHQLTEEQKVELIAKSSVPATQIHKVATAIADSSKQRDQIYKHALRQRSLKQRFTAKACRIASRMINKISRLKSKISAKHARTTTQPRRKQTTARER